MPLVDVDNTKVQPQPASGRAVPVQMKTALSQTSLEPRESLITQMEGSIYVITYYAQILGPSDAAKPLQLNLAAPYQQYNCIHGMETRLQGDLSFAVEEEGSDRVVTGEMNMYPGQPPNKGDMFVADAFDGTTGIFTITEVQPLSWFKQTAWNVQFRLVARDDQVRLDNLALKTDQNFHFVVDFVRHGKNPVLIDELYNDYRTLYRTGETMIGEYMRLYFSEVSQTLIIPGQEMVCYDPFLVSAVLSVLETTEHPLLRKLTAHNTDAQYAFRTTTIWDALLQMEPSHLHLSCQRMGLAQRSVAGTRAHFGGVYWAKIDYIVYPMEMREDVDANRTVSPYGVSERLRNSEAPVRDFNRLIVRKNVANNPVIDEAAANPKDNIPNIHHVTIDDYYVFSKAFYEEDYSGMSHLEKLVWSVLNQHELDVYKLAELVRQSKYWDKLERFYYVPVLMILAVLALRGPSL